MKSRTIILTTLIGCLALWSCEKHRLDKEATPEAYTLFFTSPTAGQSFSVNDSIAITGKAIYKQSIHGYDIRIRETNDTTVKYFAHIHDHNDTLSISHKWKSDLTRPAAMEAEIIIYLDHDGITGSRKTSFIIE